MTLVFVDCEAPYGAGSPAVADMTEFGAVISPTLTFHGTDCSQATFAAFRGWLKANCETPPVFMSDNPAYDWQWINFYFWRYDGDNPFGFSARRIGDFYAGLVGDFKKGNEWKRLRRTPHDHMPVNDAMGNYEAFQRMCSGERA